jgi:hypothetical protein
VEDGRLRNDKDYPGSKEAFYGIFGDPERLDKNFQQLVWFRTQLTMYASARAVPTARAMRVQCVCNATPRVLHATRGDGELSGDWDCTRGRAFLSPVCARE